MITYIRELLEEARECEDDVYYKVVVENTAMILANCEKVLK